MKNKKQHPRLMHTKQAWRALIYILRLPVLLPLYLYTYYVSLLFAPRCRFYPSCSRYAYEAVRIHGVLKGLWLTTQRLLKCHPWHRGGIDLVPESKSLCCANPQHQPKEYLL